MKNKFALSVILMFAVLLGMGAVAHSAMAEADGQNNDKTVDETDDGAVDETDDGAVDETDDGAVDETDDGAVDETGGKVVNKIENDNSNPSPQNGDLSGLIDENKKLKEELDHQGGQIEELSQQVDYLKKIIQSIQNFFGNIFSINQSPENS